MGKKSEGIQETPQQRAMVERAQLQLKDYKTRWLPLQQRMSKQIMEMGEQGSVARDRAQGRAATESTARFHKAGGALEKSLSSGGSGPGSSRFNLAVTGMGEDQATSRSSGMLIADQAVDDAYIQGLGALTALGRGEKAQANQGLSNLAAMSGQRAAQDAQMSLQEQMGYAQMAGQVAGVGMGQMMNNRTPGLAGMTGGGMTGADGTFSAGRDGTAQLPFDSIR